MKGNVLNEKRVKTALKKKAFGYDATEIVEEYVSDGDGEVRLSKKRVTKKNIPPDMAALKMLIEESVIPVTELSDEELEREKERLLKELSEKNRKQESVN